MLIALIGFLATIVFQWGMDISSRQNFLNENIAAVINGEEISWQDFDAVYRRIYQAQEQDSDDELSDFRRREIRNMAWQQLLHDRLVMQEAARQEITVTDEELFAYLRFSPPQEFQQMPAFQTDGVFDYQKYLGTMTNPNAASFWASVEPYVRQEIIKQKLQETVIQNAQVTEQEVRQAFWAATEKIQVGMVDIPFSRFTPAPPSTDEQLQEYFQQHNDDYQVDERAVLNLVMVNKEAQPYDWEVDSLKAIEIHDSLMAGADFAEMAQYYSDDNSAEAGGDLGWFRAGQMVAPFDEKVFSMKAGEVSEPVKTRFGWHIIKVHDFRTVEGATKSEKIKEAHASHILFKVTASTETLDRIHKRMEDFRANAAEYGFAQTAENFELPLLKTNPFEKGSAIDHLGWATEATEFAFREKVGEISPVLENQNFVYVVELAERLPAGLASFDAVKELVKADYETQVVKNLCRDTANVIYDEIVKGTAIERAATKYGAKYTVPEEFTRNTYIRGLGVAPEAVGAAFALKEPGEVSKPVDYARGSVILKLLARTPPDTTQLAAKRDSLYYVQLTAKQQQLYSAWFDHLVKTSEIVSNIEGAYVESNY